jgi:hypothetical protein
MLGARGGAHYAVVHITAAHPALPGCWTALAGRGLPDGARRTGSAPAPERAGAMAADALVVNYSL